MPTYVIAIDQASHVAPLNLPLKRRIQRHTLERMCALLSIGDATQERILQLLQAASGRIHIKDRVIGAAIYFITDISFARIAVLVGKEELTKGCTDLREEMLQHPEWKNTVEQLRKTTSTYANIGAIISKFKLSSADNINLRKIINKLDTILGDRHPKSLVRDVTIMWMAMQIAPNSPALKDVVDASGLTYQTILRTEATLRALVMA
jgi:hypothetical protein